MMKDKKVKVRLYLNKVRESNQRIRHIEEDISILRDSLESIKATDYSKEVVSSSGVQDRIAEKLSEILDLESKMIIKKYDTIQERAKLSFVINRLDSPQRDVLRYRYLDDIEFGNIADMLGYEMNYIYNLHQDGINQLADLDEFVDKLLI